MHLFIYDLQPNVKITLMLNNDVILNNRLYLNKASRLNLHHYFRLGLWSARVVL